MTPDRIKTKKNLLLSRDKNGFLSLSQSRQAAKPREENFKTRPGCFARLCGLATWRETL